MTDGPTRPSRHRGRHRRHDAAFDDFRLTDAAAVLPRLVGRTARRHGGSVHTALTFRPELARLRRGLAGLGGMTLLTLSLMGAAPATGNAETDAGSVSTTSTRAAEADRREPATDGESGGDDPMPAPPEPNDADEKTPPKPVAGLDATQMDNAVSIVKAGEKLDVPRKGQVVAVATAMQESKLKNLASHAVPESLDHDNDGFGADHDSVGLFQQRPSMGWGTVADCMDAGKSSTAFYRALNQVDGWQELPVSQAAQAVQASAHPQAYAQWEDLALAVVAEVDG